MTSRWGHDRRRPAAGRSATPWMVPARPQQSGRDPGATPECEGIPGTAVGDYDVRVVGVELAARMSGGSGSSEVSLVPFGRWLDRV